MSNIFIAYARQDRNETERIVDALQSARILGWKDGTDLAAGESASPELREAINGANAVLAVISPRALDTGYVFFELGAAMAAGKKIIPVIVSGDVEKSDLTGVLGNREPIDARNKAPHEVVREIEHAMRAA